MKHTYSPQLDGRDPLIAASILSWIDAKEAEEGPRTRNADTRLTDLIPNPAGDAPMDAPINAADRTLYCGSATMECFTDVPNCTQSADCPTVWGCTTVGSCLPNTQDWSCGSDTVLTGCDPNPV